MNYLLQALGDVKPAGNNKWMAICPVHGGNKNKALMISLRDDNSVGAHCFSCGANGLDLYRHLGLPLDELNGYKEYTQVVPREIQETYDTDKLIIRIYKADKEKGIEIGYKDERRYKLALSRKQGIENKFKDIV